MTIHFERRKKYGKLSFTAILLVLILLILFIPIMLISRAKLILNHKLDLANSDSSYVHLVQAAYSYLETADAFVIFKSSTKSLKDKIYQKALNHYLQKCDSTTNCYLWEQILKNSDLQKCENCASY